MNLEDLARKVCKESDLTLRGSRELMRFIKSQVEDALLNGDGLNVKGIGYLYRESYKSRYRDMKTHTLKKIKVSTVKFKCSTAIKNKLKNK